MKQYCVELSYTAFVDADSPMEAAKIGWEDIEGQRSEDATLTVTNMDDDDDVECYDISDVACDW